MKGVFAVLHLQHHKKCENHKFCKTGVMRCDAIQLFGRQLSDLQRNMLSAHTTHYLLHAHFSSVTYGCAAV
jgi:hypothetical protein